MLCVVTVLAICGSFSFHLMNIFHYSRLFSEKTIKMKKS